MRVSLMLTGSGYILKKCRPLRKQVEDLISGTVATGNYGTTLELLLVNVIIQDSELIEPEIKLSRKSRDIRVDVALSRKSVECAQDSEIKLALLACLVKAVKITKQRLTRKDDDFDTDKLITDLKAIMDQLK